MAVLNRLINYGDKKSIAGHMDLFDHIFWHYDDEEIEAFSRKLVHIIMYDSSQKKKKNARFVLGHLTHSYTN